MADKSSTTNKFTQTSLVIVATVAILFVLKVSRDVAVPLVFSFFCFLLFSPLLRRMDKLHIPSFLSVTFVMALLLLLFLLTGWFIVMTVDSLIRLIPFYADKVVSLDRLLSGSVSAFIELPEGASFLAILPVNWSNLAISSLTSISNKFFSFTKVAMVVYIFFLFLLLERQSIIPKVLAAAPKRGMRAAVMFERITRQVSKYLLLKAVISAFTGVFFFLTAVMTGLDLPILWGVLAFIFNFIPSVGSVIVTALTILMALIQFAPVWSNVLWVAVLTISTQTILGNIIDPRLQGGQLNLSPFVILVSLSVWGFIWGVPGMFIAVPLTSVLQILCANIKSLRAVAILISSGKGYQRESARQQVIEKYLRKQERRRSKGLAVEEQIEEVDEEIYKGDFILPENFNDL
jgi:AI-2 transport protein TqsA